ncbi:amidohydrolase [Agromyces luteolus]|uniref:Amidohydrolase family protein n=1 Tax=Agromyces luteolus TaxID=88373 RepID=A0A7C9LD85_9MICO|nr:amidohydrolase [Agromyces luteolus]MUN07332.1 amidohydrolase family protein [Agromyces luteolus]GLK28590.1 amidohydrolase [Agromyces luteolus]
MTRRTVYVNARVFTADEPAWAEAIAVDDGTILAVGTEPEVRAAVGGADPGGADVETVDLDGRLVLPGVIDAHTHLVMMGEALGRVGLTDARSLDEIRARLVAARAAAPDAPRVLGRGWLFDSVPGSAPTAAMLDEVLPDVPIYLDANDYHSCWVNSAALAELGITRDTPDPIGGRIGRDAEGEPDGMLYETAAQQYAWEHLAAQATDADRDAAVERTIAAYLATGVTGVVDMAFDELGLAAFRRAAERRGGTLPIRVVAHWFVANTGDASANLAQVARAASLADEVATPWLRIAGIKLVLDGVIDACTAAMRHPYVDGSNAEPIWPLEALEPVVAAADAAGLQVALHAIGDAASGIALDALEHAHAVNGDRDRRHRIEHLEFVDRADVARLARLGVVASMQPVHADPAIWANWAAMLGDERADRGFPWTEITDAGAVLAFSTDAPTAPHEALPNLYVAATRRSALDDSFPANHPEYAVPLADAVRHATRDAAYSCREEGSRGRLAPGLAADFAVIDRDPFELGDDALLEARVIRTVVAGRTAYRADARPTESTDRGARAAA